MAAELWEKSLLQCVNDSGGSDNTGKSMVHISILKKKYWMTILFWNQQIEC